MKTIGKIIELLHSDTDINQKEYYSIDIELVRGELPRVIVHSEMRFGEVYDNRKSTYESAVPQPSITVEPVEIAISRRVKVRKGNRPHLYQIFLDDKHYYYIADEMLPYDSLFHLPQWKVDELNDVLCTQFSCDKLESYLLKDFLKDNETL